MKKLVIALALGAAAATAAHRVSLYSHDDVTADSLATRTHWLCRSCDHAFMLTAREVMTQADKLNAPMGVAPLECVGCRVRQAYRAKICESCGGAFFGMSVPGATGACPRCKRNAGPEVVATQLPIRGSHDDEQGVNEVSRRRVNERPIQAH